VSHNLVAIEGLCDRVIVLDSGSLVCDAPARAAISEYLGQGSSVAGSADLRRSLRSGDGLTAVLTSVQTQDDSETQVDSVRCGDPLTVRIRYEHKERLESPIFGIVFKRADGLVVSHLNSQIMSTDRLQSGRCGEAICRIASLPLVPGEYTVSVGIAVGVQTLDLVDDAMTVSVTPADYYGTGRLPQQGTLVLDGQWTSSGTD
jgi:lipopolysaccharide transport system ATP-binding protein